MSTAAQVRTAWDTNVMQHATVQAMTTSIIDDDFRTLSKKDLSRLRFGQEFHFIQYIVTRQEVTGIIGGRKYHYEVELNYYLEAVPDGSNHVTAVDNMETIDGLISSELGNSWGSTVDLEIKPEDAPEIEQIEISSKPVWKVSQVYEAEKIVST